MADGALPHARVQAMRRRHRLRGAITDVNVEDPRRPTAHGLNVALRMLLRVQLRRVPGALLEAFRDANPSCTPPSPRCPHGVARSVSTWGNFDWLPSGKLAQQGLV
eukprot:2846289-Pyramimonas_sp.AAC.1